MKRLAAVCVTLLVLAIGTQAYGNVLVYNLYGSLQTVDTVANAGDTKVVLGYMVMDVNQTTGVADQSSVILYGRQGRRDRVYTLYDNVVNFAQYGNHAAVTVDTGLGGTIIMTGRIRTQSIGTRRQPLRIEAAASLNGAMSLQWAILFDLDESLVGAGAMQASLNEQVTRSFYSSADGAAEAVDALLANLEARGYLYLSSDEEPPTPDDPGGGGEPIPN